MTIPAHGPSRIHPLGNRSGPPSVGVRPYALDRKRPPLPSRLDLPLLAAAAISNTVAGRLVLSAERPNHTNGLVSSSLIATERLARPHGVMLTEALGNIRARICSRGSVLSRHGGQHLRRLAGTHVLQSTNCRSANRTRCQTGTPEGSHYAGRSRLRGCERTV